MTDQITVKAGTMVLATNEASIYDTGETEGVLDLHDTYCETDKQDCYLVRDMDPKKIEERLGYPFQIGGKINVFVSDDVRLNETTTELQLKTGGETVLETIGRYCVIAMELYIMFQMSSLTGLASLAGTLTIFPENSSGNPYVSRYHNNGSEMI
jgi:hypothetical protein